MRIDHLYSCVNGFHAPLIERSLHDRNGAHTKYAVVYQHHQARCYLVAVGMRLLGNARTGPLFTDSYHCNQLLTKYAKDPHVLAREL